jgi:hypothetical protein
VSSRPPAEAGAKSPQEGMILNPTTMKKKEAKRERQAE